MSGPTEPTAAPPAIRARVPAAFAVARSGDSGKVIPDGTI